MRQNTHNALIKAQDKMFGNVSFRHCKTVEDIHASTIVTIKFMGDLTQNIQVISSDVSGQVYLSEFREGTLALRWKV